MRHKSRTNSTLSASNRSSLPSWRVKTQLSPSLVHLSQERHFRCRVRLERIEVWCQEPLKISCRSWKILTKIAPWLRTLARTQPQSCLWTKAHPNLEKLDQFLPSHWPSVTKLESKFTPISSHRLLWPLVTQLMAFLTGYSLRFLCIWSTVIVCMTSFLRKVAKE